ncbi:hypothetical protein G9P44_005961 [Scheffersomyces stipitis]|nr:hypothetical protein G9P44_005961 [Scheffersomyces stipitis]
MSISQLIVAIVGVAAGEGSTSANKCLVAFVCSLHCCFRSHLGSSLLGCHCRMLPTLQLDKSPSPCVQLPTGCGTGVLPTLLLTWSTPVQVTPTWVPRFSSSGVVVISLVVFFVWYLVYETKGLTLEQIDEMYEKVPKAWQSTRFIPSEHAFTQPSAAASVSSGKAEGVSEVEEASV